MTRVLFSILSLAAIAAPVAAQADVETRIVAVADLDLASDSGRLALDRRLTRAAIEVCGIASPADLAGANDVRACRVRTLADARAVGDRRIALRAGEAIRVAAR